MIYGERIRLRPIERDDLPNFVRWFQDPEVREGLFMVVPFSMAQEERWFERMLEASAKNPGSQPFAVETRVDDDTWQHIGSCGLDAIDNRSRSAELGIAIGDKTFWNQGLGTDAVRTITRFGFDTLNLHRVFLRVYSYNKRAIRAYEKAGFHHEGRWRESHFFNGQYHDTLFMAVLNHEFER